jgi:hypothetical protein
LAYSNGSTWIFTYLGVAGAPGSDSFATATGSTVAGKFSGSGDFLGSDGAKHNDTAKATLTTKGDVLGHNGTISVRIPTCTNDQIHIADSTQASGWKCGAQTGGGGSSAFVMVMPISDWGPLDENNALTRADAISRSHVNPQAPAFLGDDANFRPAVYYIRAPSGWTGSAPTLRLIITHANNVVEDTGFSVDIMCDGGSASGSPTTFTVHDATMWERFAITRTTPVPGCMATAKEIGVILRATNTTTNSRSHYLQYAEISWPL